MLREGPEKVCSLLVATAGEISSFVSVSPATEDACFFDRWIMEKAVDSPL